ncbi:MAG: hypothetical protein LBG19_10405 [Prevotellaceae bacterium]|nr:hypothetical protein [Prevotellaceae bacterium]
MTKASPQLSAIKCSLHALLLCFLFTLASCKRTDKSFSLDFIDNVTSIGLSQDSSVVKLTKAGDVWMVNDSFEAGYEQMDMLLYLINTQHVSLQLPEEQAVNASEILLRDGIKIKVFEDKKNVLDITVGTNDSLGYFGRSGKNKQLYKLSLPDIVDNPFSFLSANPSFWKHNVIITTLPSEIKSATIDNLENPEQSFRIIREADGSLSLFDIYNREDVANIDQAKLNTYLGYFTGLSYEQILDLEDADQKAILLSDSPYSMTIELKDGEQIKLQLYYITGDENLDAYGNALKYDPNQLYLSMNNGRDIALAKWVSFDLLLRDLSYFVEN